MKRVLLTVHKFFPRHGAGTEVLTLKVAQELKQRGYEVLVLTADPPDVDARRKEAGAAESEYVYEGVPVKVFEESLRLAAGYSFRHEYYHPDIKQAFERVVAQFKPDILHIFHAQNLSASIVEAAKEQHLPIAFSATDFWFVCPVVQLKRPDGSVCRGPGPGARKCLSCYTPQLFPEQEEFDDALKARKPRLAALLGALPAPVAKLGAQVLYSAYKSTKLKDAVAATVERPGVLRSFANQIDCIMVPTRLMQDIFVENGIEPKRVRKVGFGIDTRPLTPYQVKKPSDRLRIGFIGTIFEHKGVDLLIEAFQSLPPDANAELKIYGDPNQFPEYGRRVQELASRPLPNSEKIRFLGRFPNSELGPVLTEVDVLVVPSRWYENTPLVIQSALATRTPLIATDLGGLSELIIHEENGLLFELNNVKSLKAQFERLLQEPGLLQSLTDGIKPERTVADMVDDIESVYREIMPANARGTIASLTTG